MSGWGGGQAVGVGDPGDVHGGFRPPPPTPAHKVGLRPSCPISDFAKERNIFMWRSWALQFCEGSSYDRTSEFREPCWSCCIMSKLRNAPNVLNEDRRMQRNESKYRTSKSEPASLIWFEPHQQKQHICKPDQQKQSACHQ